jgi:energy-converting hydrogenase A subunit C
VEVAQLSEDLIALLISAGIGLFAVIRILIEKKSLRKLPYLNVLGFAIAGSIALLIPHPLAIVAAVAYFVGSTLESNAIASSYAGGKERND